MTTAALFPPDCLDGPFGRVLRLRAARRRLSCVVIDGDILLTEPSGLSRWRCSVHRGGQHTASPYLFWRLTHEARRVDGPWTASKLTGGSSAALALGTTLPQAVLTISRILRLA